jgi:hypothetical protein
VSDLCPFYVVLLHHPVVNRNGQLVTTAVTNMDIHDIARSARTFGARGYFIVTPIEDQHELVNRILTHWRSEEVRRYHPDRAEAVSLVRLARSFDEVKAAVKAECSGPTKGNDPEVVLTDARPLPNSISYADYRQLLSEASEKETKRPRLVCFGTGWGVSEVFYPEVHRVLAPVYGPEGDSPEGYNHLSVRSAVAIILDRLFGK